ncbi:out at first protein, partial [Anoplophora glabripennis]
MCFRLSIFCYPNLFVLCMFVLVKFTDTQLVINVRNQGGDVVQENISANVTDDTVTLEFQRSDGTLVTQLIDFRN